MSTTIYMSTTGNGTNDGSSFSLAVSSFNDALELSANTDNTIILEDGIYSLRNDGTGNFYTNVYFNLYQECKIQAQTTLGVIISGGDFHHALTTAGSNPYTGVPYRLNEGGLKPWDIINGAVPWFRKYDPGQVNQAKMNPDAPMKIEFEGIKFKKIHHHGTGPLFGTVGEDEFTFNKCVFEDIGVANGANSAVGNVGWGGLIGTYFSDTSTVKYILRPSRVNCRGIFNNCAFKRLFYMVNRKHGTYIFFSQSPYTQTGGVFNCYGSYLRFANCTIDLDFRYKTWHRNANYTHNGSHNVSLLLACNPGVLKYNTGTKAWDEQWSVAGTAQRGVYGDPGDWNIWPVNDVKFINCILYNRSTGTKNTAGYRNTRGLSLAAGSRFGNVNPTYALSAHGHPAEDYVGTPALQRWPVAALSGDATNIYGDNAWYNSEFINCSFYQFENGNNWHFENSSLNWTTLGFCINKFTNCVGSAAFDEMTTTGPLSTLNVGAIHTAIRGEGKDADPMFISPESVENEGYTDDYNLRPASPVIAMGTPVPSTFYDYDKPDTLISIL